MHLTLKVYLSLILQSHHLPMSLSTEAIISIVGVLTNLPPAVLIYGGFVSGNGHKIATLQVCVTLVMFLA
jgi:hypothetical protein